MKQIGERRLILNIKKQKQIIPPASNARTSWQNWDNAGVFRLLFDVMEYKLKKQLRSRLFRKTRISL